MAQLPDGEEAEEEPVIVSMVKLGNNLKVLDGDLPSLKQFKQGLSEGQVVQAEFTVEPKEATTQQWKYFHKLRDRYSSEMGSDKEVAKDELCCLWGVAMTAREALEHPPEWTGKIVEPWEGTGKYYRKTVREYTRDEWSALIDGTIMQCSENGVYIEDLVSDYRQAMRGAA